MATVIRREWGRINENFHAVMGNCSISVKILCCTLPICYFLSFSHGALHLFTAVPGNVLPPNFWIWTLATHSIIEIHIWLVVVDLIVIVLYGKLLEPLWGALEMLIFYAILTTVVAILTTVTYICVYLLSGNPDHLFNTYIHGMAAYVAGFTVAVKQVMADSVLVNSSFGKLRNRHIPLIVLIFTIIMRLIGICDGPYPIMFGWGILISWIYLRFYQKHSSGNRGDMAESFSFASFFPSQLQPFVIIISNMLFTILVGLKICKKPQRRYNVGATTAITVSLPGMDPVDAERRRQVALKALNDRLAKVESPSWPSMEDGAESGSLVTSNVKFNENTSAVSVNIGVDDHQLPSASVPVLQTDSS